jgi:thiamine biosynthesis lipoprotein
MSVESPAWRWNGYSFRAMNTKIQTWLFSQTNNEVLVDVQRLFNSVEKRLSRFNPHSELSALNQHRSEVFEASPLLLDALEVALWAAQTTGGLYDPTILARLQQAGYDRSFELMENPRPLNGQPTPVSGEVAPRSSPSTETFRSIHLNRAQRQITKPVGLGLDLGGMGKGYTVDRAADRLQGLGPFMVNAGGDIFAYQAPPGQKGWPVDLVHPFKPTQFFARLHLQHTALATSTIARRRWQKNGQMMHHLIDPRTGQPACTDAVSVSVVAPRTALAEIYAKAALILGAEPGLAYLQGVPGVEGLLVTANAEILMTPGFVPLVDRLTLDGYGLPSSP